MLRWPTVRARRWPGDETEEEIEAALEQIS